MRVHIPAQDGVLADLPVAAQAKLVAIVDICRIGEVIANPGLRGFVGKRHVLRHDRGADGADAVRIEDVQLAVVAGGLSGQRIGYYAR